MRRMGLLKVVEMRNESENVQRKLQAMEKKIAK